MRSLPFIAFFVSGASSLIFQTLWTRVLHHVFGATSVAISSVLTVFMAGLGLGAFAFGRWGDRIRRPLVAYASFELVVGLIGVVIPLLVASDGALAHVNAWLRESLGAGSFGFMLARFALVVPLLIVPTTLMGATLPLLARHFVEAATDPQQASARVGALYAVNTLGAVFGTGLGAFVLMPTLGVWRTNLFAAGLNLVLAVAIWSVRDWLEPASATPLQPPRVDSRAAIRENTPPVTEARPGPEPAARVSPRGRWLMVVAFGVSGACALGYEVVWSRALAMAIGSSVHGFALILETFLIGIALGSASLATLLHEPATPRSTSLRERLRAVPRLRVAALWSLGMAPVAHAHAAVQYGLVVFGCAVVVSWAAIALCTAAALGQVRRTLALDTDAAPQVDAPGLAWTCLMVPLAGAMLHAVSAATSRSKFAAASIHGYLPYITLTVVTLVCAFVALLMLCRSRLLLSAALLQLYIALATFGSYLCQDEIPYMFARLVTSLPDLPSHVGSVRFFMFFAAALCTLPATLGMGAMFPLTLRAWSSGGAHVASDVGTVYASNTLGSILGAWLPGFVLMPWIGMESTLLIGMLLNLGLSLSLVVTTHREPQERGRARWPRYALAAGLAPLGVALLFATRAEASPLRWNLSHMTLGAFRVSLANNVLDPQGWGEPDLVYYHDGVSTTVSVERWGSHLTLKNNGKVDASNGDDMATQIMVAAYPLLLHPEGPKDLNVALVGFGSGVTVGAVLQFPVAHVDVMELEASVVEAAAEYFGEVNHLERTREDFPYVEAPRLSVYADDGRNFLAASSAQYDVIISEPSNPWITGVSDLFTAEHFEITKRRLASGGVYCQWVQLYEMSPDNIKTIYRTFARNYAHVAVFAAAHFSSDTILVGSDSPLPFSLRHVAEGMAEPRTREELERAHVLSPHDAYARTLFASREEVLRYAHHEERLQDGLWRPAPRANGAEPCPAASCRRVPAPLNTDDNMRIELAAPRDLIGFSAFNGYLRTLYRPDWPYGQLFERLRDDGAPPSPHDDAEMALALAANGREVRAMQFARRAQQAPSGTGEALPEQILAAFQTPLERWPAPFLTTPEPGPQMDRATARYLEATYSRVVHSLHAKRYPEALSALESVPQSLLLQSGPALRLLYGYLLLRAEDGDSALARSAVGELESLAREEPGFVTAHPETLFYLARAQDRIGSYPASLRSMRLYLGTPPGPDEPQSANEPTQ